MFCPISVNDKCFRLWSGLKLINGYFVELLKVMVLEIFQKCLHEFHARVKF